MNLFWILLLVGSVSWVITGFIHRYALANNMIDVPNERSSHTTPTARGGGIAIVISFIMGLLLLWNISQLGNEPFTALVGSGLLIAIVGVVDDQGHIAARWRLLTHFSAAGWLLFWLGGCPPLLLFETVYDLGWAGNIIAAVALVWLLNLYNFMDGIDGIAGIEALSSSLAAGLLLLFVLDYQEMASLHLLIAAAVTGFLVWNFPPAMIFMGDVGSGFLGLMLGALVLCSTHVEPQMLWVWLILLGVFFVDATYTLTRRLLRGDKLYEAHRSHAYQYASRKYGRHLPVTLAVFVINLCWLVPWSLAVVLGAVDGVVGLLCAYAPLLWIAKYFHAGELELIK
ncbi:MAG: glycosyltransferase family 4 protein [Gammaproteobacteria bacterium]|nr:glycosyltransferase family 4 protein [Gammaproteobacteria bacterium]